MRISRDFDNDLCPVSDDMLGALYRASREGLPELIATVDPDLRAQLATYCYRRAHLKSIGLAIASTCNERDLLRWGGTAGAALYARSHEKLAATAATAAPAAYASRQRITLSSGALRKNLPIDEDPDSQPDAEDLASADGQADAEEQDSPQARIETETQADSETQVSFEAESGSRRE